MATHLLGWAACKSDKNSSLLEFFILNVDHVYLHVTESRKSEFAHQGAIVIPDLDKGPTRVRAHICTPGLPRRPPGIYTLKNTELT